MIDALRDGRQARAVAEEAGEIAGMPVAEFVGDVGDRPRLVGQKLQGEAQSGIGRQFPVAGAQPGKLTLIGPARQSEGARRAVGEPVRRVRGKQARQAADHRLRTSRRQRAVDLTVLAGGDRATTDGTRQQPAVEAETGVSRAGDNRDVP